MRPNDSSHENHVNAHLRHCRSLQSEKRIGASQSRPRRYENPPFPLLRDRAHVQRHQRYRHIPFCKSLSSYTHPPPLTSSTRRISQCPTTNTLLPNPSNHQQPLMEIIPTPLYTIPHIQKEVKRGRKKQTRHTQPNTRRPSRDPRSHGVEHKTIPGEVINELLPTPLVDAKTKGYAS